MKKIVTYTFLILLTILSSHFIYQYYTTINVGVSSPEIKLAGSTFVLGMLLMLLFSEFTIDKLKTALDAYKRELEKKSIGSTENDSKIKVLESKISVLEKALDEAINK